VDTNIVERVAGILSEHDIERFRGWPAALVVEARKEQRP